MLQDLKQTEIFVKHQVTNLLMNDQLALEQEKPQDPILDFLSWLDVCPQLSEVEALNSSMSLLSVAKATGGYMTDGWGEWEDSDTSQALKEALGTFLATDQAEVTTDIPPQAKEVN
ncbi:hypothetical protein FRC10_010144 [Ceratobasidium sp. 414]|nr:hypothetical protein FRC10_010144 [Ceratobasidium sp. 414]